ncbi:hypothetical protein AV530_008335 [Patagioenas fasciata monilis]|uniref:Uncharacterized protein n=1 Tax=Patagioenas fasciata monilis TaxID=372326 RepID=A0A1V4KPN9_PATFA|nr:hypothetical protein AV530_008335 [Patagioenas fasciata monilis]
MNLLCLVKACQRCKHFCPGGGAEGTEFIYSCHGRKTVVKTGGTGQPLKRRCHIVGEFLPTSSKAASSAPYTFDWLNCMNGPVTQSSSLCMSKLFCSSLVMLSFTITVDLVLVLPTAMEILLPTLLCKEPNPT